MNAKILVIPLTAALLGGCAWIKEQPYYIPGGTYVQRVWAPRGGYVEGGRRYYYDGGRRYYIDGGRRYYFDGNRRYYEDRGRRYYVDTPENRALRTLQREAHEEREFVKNVGKTQMKMQQQAVKAQVDMHKEAAKMQMKAAQGQMKMQQQAAKAQMKAQQQAARAQQQAAKAKMKAAGKMMKR